MAIAIIAIVVGMIVSVFVKVYGVIDAWKSPGGSGTPTQPG
jgi:hypothetical protein